MFKQFLIKGTVFISKIKEREKGKWKESDFVENLGQKTENKKIYLEMFRNQKTVLPILLAKTRVFLQQLTLKPIAKVFGNRLRKSY